MKLECKTRKSHYYNEDRFVVGSGFAMVIDGASALKKTELRPTESSWLVSRMKNCLRKRGDRSVAEVLRETSQSAYEELRRMSLQDTAYLPSAGIAWAEFSGRGIVVHTIGDCEAAFVMKDGRVLRRVNDDLRMLDRKALRRMTEIAAQRHCTPLEARPYINDLLIEHRSLMNKPGGYAVFAPDERGDFVYSEYRADAERVKELYLYTDGFAQAFETLGIFADEKDLFLSSPDLSAVIAAIVKASSEDPQCEKHPRFKVIDDITAIKIVF